MGMDDGEERIGSVRYPIPKDFRKPLESEDNVDMILLNSLYVRLESHPKLIEYQERKKREMLERLAKRREKRHTER